MIRHCTLTRERTSCLNCVVRTVYGREGIDDIADIEIVEDGAADG